MTHLRAGWSALIGDQSTKPRTRRLHITRALDQLERHGLVALGAPRQSHRYDQFELLSDDGSGDRYKVPGQRTSLEVPIAFFLQGWHLVLTQAEIATWFMLFDLSNRYGHMASNEGVGAPEVVRWGEYGISRETYLAHRELAEFGLVTCHDPIPSRKRGRVPVDQARGTLPVYRFTVKPLALDRPATDVVTSALANPTPPHLRQ